MQRLSNWYKSFGMKSPQKVKPPFRPRLDSETIGAVEGRLEVNSRTWAYIKKWAQAELKAARLKNDSTTRDIIQTTALRGRIRILKDLIELPNPISEPVLLAPEPGDEIFAGYEGGDF